MFGNTNLFLFIDPKVEKRDSPLPSFEDAQTEIAKNSGLNKLAGNGKSQGQFCSSLQCLHVLLILL